MTDLPLSGRIVQLVVIAGRFRCDTVATWENSRLAEDTALGIALASGGYPPLFTSEARVYSYFPFSRAGSEQQRERWEKARLDNIVDLVPVALAKSLRDRSLGLAALAIDMAVPPLSLFVLARLCEILGGIAFVLGALPAALAIPSLSTLLLVLGTMLAWIVVGRDVLPLRELLHLPLHATQKFGFIRGLQAGSHIGFGSELIVSKCASRQERDTTRMHIGVWFRKRIEFAMPTRSGKRKLQG